MALLTGPGSVEAPVIESFAATPLENAIIDSERPDYPMVTLTELWVGVPLDPDRLAAALATVRRRHPMMSVRLRRAGALDRGRTWERVGDPDVEPCIDLGELDRGELEAARNALLSAHLPLEVAPPFRLAVASVDDASVVLLVAHHAAFDGIGGVALLRSVAAAYVGRVPPEDTSDERLEASRRPEIPGKAVSAEGRTSPVERARWLASVTASPAARVQPAGQLEGARTPARSATRATAWLPAGGSVGERVPTANDLLLGAFHLTVEAWNRAVGAADTDRVSVTVPVSMRSENHRGRLIANLTMQADTISVASSRQDPAVLRSQLADQTARIRAGGVADEPTTWLPLRWVPVRLRPSLMRLAARVGGDRLLASARLSNLGRQDYPEFTDAGFVVEHLWFYPPVRMPQGVVVGATVIEDTIHLSFCWSRAQFDDRRGRAFAEMYGRSLQAIEAGVVWGSATAC